MNNDFMVRNIEYTCTDMPVREEELGERSLFSCAMACLEHLTCFMIRYSAGDFCNLIGEGTDYLNSTLNLLEIF